MKILIAGQGKSGTTGLYYKIKRSLPGNALCLFEPRRFERPKGEKPDMILAKILLMDEGYADYDSFNGFDKKILLVRDPRDNFISRLLYIILHSGFEGDSTKVASFLSLLERKEKAPQTVSVLEIIDLFRHLSDNRLDLVKLIKERIEFALKYHRKRNDFIVVKYEDFVDNELNELEQYLGIGLCGNAEVDKAHNRVVRTKGSGDWKNWFLKEDIDFFKTIFSGYMATYGYADDWETRPNPIIRPENCSGYVRRIVSEKQTAGKPGRHDREGILKRWGKKIFSIGSS